MKLINKSTLEILSDGILNKELLLESELFKSGLNITYNGQFLLSIKCIDNYIETKVEVSKSFVYKIIEKSYLNINTDCYDYTNRLSGIDSTSFIGTLHFITEIETSIKDLVSKVGLFIF